MTIKERLMWYGGLALFTLLLTMYAINQLPTFK